MPSQVRPRTVFVVCACVALSAWVGFVLYLAHVWLVLGMVAALLAVALDRPVSQLTRRGLGHGLAVALVMLSALVALAGIVLLIVPPAIGQGRQLVAELPDIAQKIRSSELYHLADRHLHLEEKLAGAGGSAPSFVESAAAPTVAAVKAVVGGIAGAISLFFLVIFMLLYGADLVAGGLRFLSPRARRDWAHGLSHVYRVLGGYIGGLFLICAVNAAVTTTFLAAIGVRFFLPLGTLSGLSSLLPMVGNTLAGIIITLFALSTGGLWRAIAVASFFVLYQQFENHVLGPVVYRRTVSLNPLVVILGLLGFGELGGVVGAMLAVPALACAQVLLTELTAHRRPRARPQSQRERALADEAREILDAHPPS